MTNHDKWYNYMSESTPMPIQYKKNNDGTVRPPWQTRCSRCHSRLDPSYWEEWRSVPEARQISIWIHLVLTWCKEPYCRVMNAFTKGGDHDVRNQTDQPSLVLSRREGKSGTD